MCQPHITTVKIKILVFFYEQKNGGINQIQTERSDAGAVKKQNSACTKI